MTQTPYESTDGETLAEIMREAESLFAAQLQAAIAADQRALTFSGLLVAGVGALVAITGSAARPAFPIVLIATLLGLAACAALWSARPTKWFFAGTEPSQWKADLENKTKTLHSSKADLIAHYDAHILLNRTAMKHASMAMRGSLGLTAAALVFAIGWAWWRVIIG